jgi:carboxyl-terminal processing protease
MRRVPKIIWSLLACVVCIVITAAVCMVYFNKGSSSDKYLEVMGIVNQDFYEERDNTGMEDASAKAMVASLGDPSSFYMTGDEYEAYKLAMTNQYVGIGISTERSEKYNFLTVISVTPGSPADQAHIKVGNLISAVNNINVEDYTPEEFNELIRSFDDNEIDNDKYFTLHLLNTQGGKAEVKLKCELIYAEPVYYYIFDKTTIGYLKIKNFDDSAAMSLKNAISELRSAGATSLILDVRDNVSGKPGELSEALDMLLPKGDMFFLRDRSGKETLYSSGSSYTKMPMVVLVNENTSSAAEVFAAVMQQGGYKIIGRRTAGNALSQVIVELEDGSAVRISKYEYLNPDKKSMSDLGGVSPDIVSYQIADSEMDVQLEAALDEVE